MATQSMILQDLLLRVCTFGFWEQKGSNPHTLTALTVGGLALSSGARRGRTEMPGWGHAPVAIRAVDSASHKTTFLPWRAFLR